MKRRSTTEIAAKLAVRDSDPTPLPSALSLFKPASRAFMLNLVETAKLFGIPLFAGVVAWLCFYIGFKHSGSTTEAVFNGLGAVSLTTSIGLFFAILPAFMLIQLRSAREEVANYKDEFLTGLPLFWRFTGVNIAVSLLVLGGLLLLVVPGLYAYQRFMNAPYYVLEQEMGVRAALRASARDAKLYSKAMWGYVGVSQVIKALAFLPFGHGTPLLITSLLQLIYGYAQPVRYVEIVEARREITLAERHHLKRPRRTAAHKTRHA